ncbi:hypothetical protein F4680DRAFT_305140 [Xylaria scruposa]|nr:hypothetical protein F4680DRAFT_305140 [Xylaria scruposa]
MNHHYNPNDLPFGFSVISAMPGFGFDYALNQPQNEASDSNGMLYQPTSHFSYDGLDGRVRLDSRTIYMSDATGSAPFPSDASNMVLGPYNTCLNYGYSQATGPSSIPSAPPPPPSPSPSSAVAAEVSAAKSFQCNVCSRDFRYKKDLNRHMKTVHTTGSESIFQCRCEKTDMRKDNYVRHVRLCKRRYILSEYSCRCANACADKEDHLDHVNLCQYGSGRPGRPRVAQE